MRNLTVFLNFLLLDNTSEAPLMAGTPHTWFPSVLTGQRGRHGGIPSKRQGNRGSQGSGDTLPSGTARIRALGPSSRVLPTPGAPSPCLPPPGSLQRVVPSGLSAGRGPQLRPQLLEVSKLLTGSELPGRAHGGRFINDQVVTLSGPRQVAATPRRWPWPE